MMDITDTYSVSSESMDEADLEFTHQSQMKKSSLSSRGFAKPTTKKQKKKKPHAHTSNIDKIAYILQQSLNRDGCDVYGELIAMKLRTYTARKQALVQYLINSIIFEADMEKELPTDCCNMNHNDSITDDEH